MKKFNNIIQDPNHQWLVRPKFLIALLCVLVSTLAIRAYADGYYEYCGSTDNSPAGSCGPGDSNNACTITENPSGSCQFDYWYYCINGSWTDQLNVSHGTCTNHPAGNSTCNIDP